MKKKERNNQGGGDQCSYTQVDEYFSYRREAKTGRMATFFFSLSVNDLIVLM